MHCSCKKEVEKSNEENLRVIKNTFPNKSGNLKSLKKYLQQLEGCSTNMHIVRKDLLRTLRKLVCLRFYVPCDQGNNTEHCVAKILQGIRETFFDENNRKYNSCKFSCRFVFIPFLSFRRNQKQESNFLQVGDLLTRNISVFCLQRVVLYFKVTLNSIDFYKNNFPKCYSCYNLRSAWDGLWRF